MIKKGNDSLEGLLEEIAAAEEGGDICVQAALSAVGERSFGPLLLIPGLIALSPLSGVPGVPTFVGLMTLLITSQLLLGRKEIWLPGFILQRTISRQLLDKAMKVLRTIARIVDRLVKPRLTLFASGPARYVIALLCLLLSLIAPFLELLPFVITGVGAAITAFGVALLSRDGLLTLVAFGFCAAAAAVAIQNLG